MTESEIETEIETKLCSLLSGLQGICDNIVNQLPYIVKYELYNCILTIIRFPTLKTQTLFL